MTASPFVIDAPEISGAQPAIITDILTFAASRAHAPISSFQVGAMAVGNSGKAYLGCNIEWMDVALNQTVHAEQFAIALARLHGETGLRHLVVSEIPCGHCRQFLLELGQPDLPIVVAKTHSWLETQLSDLLPHPFTLAAYKRHSLMTPSAVFLKQVDTGQGIRRDELASSALQAASKAYVPYTRSWSGCAIQTTSQCIYAGGSMESAAYNPGMSAIQTALIHLKSENESFLNIEEVVYAEVLSTPVSSIGAARYLLSKIAPEARFSVISAIPDAL